MKIHPEGYKILSVSLLTLTLLNFALFSWAGRSLLLYTILIGSIVLASVLINFFRSPRRIFSSDTENLLVAPADGTIVVIEETFEEEWFREKRMQVSIFMSLFDAHVNWIPVNGKIIHNSHQNGRFMAAYLPKSSRENERSTVVIERENGEQILLRQVAGAMAKRIVTYSKENQICRINEQLGFIKFGSRIDLFLPLDTRIMVKMDEKVKGNKTIIARL
ncbi:MAG: phosphatidylserine decarboxylase family protein [Dysgonamonadaceae bacterium]|jgi:phosphatidylserine decarboxylase|nr:phosphatidylserine decarboxylase family protein [Dysgonamonadaceae bacterium]